jgi:hypothetical protein
MRLSNNEHAIGWVRQDHAFAIVTACGYIASFMIAMALTMV